MRFKKQFIIILFFSAINYSAFSQLTKATVKPEPVTDSVAAAICSCIAAYKDSITTRQQLFTVLQSCLQKYSMPRMDMLLAENGFVQSDDRKTRAAAIRAVGQKLGQKVSAECADVKALIKTFADEAPKKELH